MDMKRAVIFIPFVALRIPKSHLVYICDYLVTYFLSLF